MRTLRSLLVLPVLFAVAACDSGSPAEVEPAPNIVQVAQSVNAETGEFSVLIAALVRANLVDALTAPGPFTVFAPTDAAFAALDLDAAAVSQMPVADLTAILLYHVAPGRLPAATVVGRSSIAMASGGTTQISLANGAAFIDDARIVTTDVEASNGIIHIIDAVLLP